MKRNFESNIPMGYRRKIERAQMMQRSDVYGTDIFNDGITSSIREVSAYWCKMIYQEEHVFDNENNFESNNIR